MSNTNIFELASRKKLRFESTKGLLTAEDLWALPLTGAAGTANLDDIARALYEKLATSPKVVSFVKQTTTADDSITQLKFDVVKHVLDVKVAERDAREAAASRSETKQKILALVAQKQDAQMAEKSVDELLKLAESL